MTDLINHKYTIVEIEKMRIAVNDLMFPTVWRSATHGWVPGSGGRPGEQEKKVEEQVRTYMLAGVRLEELEALCKNREEQSERQRQSFEK